VVPSPSERELALVDPTIGRRVLIADDDPFARRLLAVALESWGYEPEGVDDGLAALDRLMAPDAPRLAVVDWMMPGLDGPEICRRVRSRMDGSYAYVVLATSRRQRTDVLAGLDAGADDYLLKPFDLEELRVRLRNGRRVVSLHAELVRTREAYRQMATHDGLTGISNRVSVREQLQTERSRVARHGPDATLAAVLLDIDHFKRVNDGYGHAAGDAVLRQVAERIRGALRDYDGFGRYGGEEFLVVLPDTGPDAAMATAERLRHAIASAPFDIGSTSLRVTASFGVVPCQQFDDLDSAIAAADAALYEAKAAGRNRVSMARVPAGTEDMTVQGPLRTAS